MIKVKIKREKSTLNAITRRAKKTAKKENFTTPLKIVTDDIKTFLREGITNGLQGGKPNNKFNHIYFGTLLGTVGNKVTQTQKFGDDFQHNINVGYITGIPRAVLLEQGNELQSLTIEEVLEWMDAKPNFKGLEGSARLFVARRIQFKLATKGPDAYPIVRLSWLKNRGKYLKEVLETVAGIWNA